MKHIFIAAILLAGPAWGACLPADQNGDGQITISEVIAVINQALAGCDPPGRFQHGPLATTDTKTGLIWEHIGCDSGDDTYRAAKAHALAYNSEGFAGRSDWRLPTRAEFATLVQNGTAAPGFVFGQCYCEAPACNQDNFLTYWTADIADQDAAWAFTLTKGTESLEQTDEELTTRLVAGP